MAMTRQADQDPEQHAEASRALKRRGILAAAGAVVAGLIAKKAAESQTVSANGATWTMPYDSGTVTFPGALLALTNNSSGGSGIFVNVASGPGLYASTATDFGVNASTSAGGVFAGVTGTGVTYGVTGYGSTGVSGVTQGTGPGVRGEPGAFNMGNVNGVEGQAGGNFSGIAGFGGPSNGNGAYGQGGGTTGTGVVGLAAGGLNPTPGTVRAGVYGNDIGVRGEAAGVNGSGVFGTTDVGATAPAPGGGAGVQGHSANGYGVFAGSTNNVALYAASANLTGVYGQTGGVGQYGVVGVATPDNSFGLAGIANGNGSAAFAGGTSNVNAFAASFLGHVQVFGGAFDVLPMGNKHGLAQHPDGSWRTFYSVESPECWVEDFGEGTLANGAADVALEKDFAALIHTDKYHVFLTPHGDHHLHVAQRHDGGFSVAADTALAALKGKKASDLAGTFSWRVVAKPKTTANVDRLANARIAPKIDFAKVPKPPQAPK